MSPHEATLIAQALRSAGRPRDEVKPFAQALANLIDSKALAGRHFSYPQFMAQALGPSVPLVPKAPPVVRPDGTTMAPPPRSARLFRSYETPEALGL